MDVNFPTATKLYNVVVAVFVTVITCCINTYDIKFNVSLFGQTTVLPLRQKADSRYRGLALVKRA